MMHGFPKVLDTQSSISREINQIGIAQGEQGWIETLFLMQIVESLFRLTNV